MGQGARWGRRLPPLIMGGVALALMMAVLPSSLHLPVTGPGGQAEVAPVPGQGSSQANLSALGLADSGTVGSGGAGGVADGSLPPIPPPLSQLLTAMDGRGGPPQQAHCVGNPPRQTEDPLSPPCLASWSGSPGGASHRGVTPSVVTVVIVSKTYGHDGADYTQGAKANDDPYDTTARALLRFFQSRFITYGRGVRVVLYRGTGQTTGGNNNLTYPELKQRYNPFAIIVESTPSAIPEQAAADGVMVFDVEERATGGFCALSGRDLVSQSPHSWCFTPDRDTVTRAYSNYVCSGLAGKKATQAGAPLNTQTRRFGILGSGASTTGLATALKQQCGVNAATYAYTSADYNNEAAKLQTDGITSVLNPDPNIIQGAPKSNYFPEWIWAAASFDTPSTLRHNPNTPAAEMAGSFGIVDRWRWRPNPQPYWYQAAQQTAPGITPDTTAGTTIYLGLMMAFSAIQRAGVNLTPQTVQSGLEGMAAADALPWSPLASFGPSDHSYQDDFMIARWDASGTAPGASEPGCERLPDQGARYLPQGPWPANDRAATSGPTDPCLADEADGTSSVPDANNS